MVRGADSSQLFLEVVSDFMPVFVAGCAKLDPLASKLFRAVVGAVIDEEIPFVEVFIVGEDEAFVSTFAEVFLDPVEFVGPCGRVSPWGCGEDVGIELFRQEME